MSPAAPAKPKARVRLTIRTTSGHFEDEFNLHERVERLLHEAIKRLHLADGPGVSYVIRRERGQLVMNPGERLSAYELLDGDTILIQSTQAEDGEMVDSTGMCRFPGVRMVEPAKDAGRRPCYRSKIGQQGRGRGHRPAKARRASRRCMPVESTI